jgi:hypothetical protein
MTQIRKVQEPDIDETLDARIKTSLCRCFPNDSDTFGKTRAWHGSYPSFSIVMEDRDDIVAHVGIVDRTVRVGDTSLRVAGIQNVFVLADYRGQFTIRVSLAESGPSTKDFLPQGVDLSAYRFRHVRRKW